jgi:hypothetical protein
MNLLRKMNTMLVNVVKLHPGDFIVVNGKRRSTLHLSDIEVLVALRHASETDPRYYAQACTGISNKFPRMQLHTFTSLYEVKHHKVFSYNLFLE